MSQQALTGTAVFAQLAGKAVLAPFVGTAVLPPLAATAVPARLAGLFGHGMPAALAQRLAESARLRPRLEALVLRRVGTLGPLDAVSRRALAMDTQALGRLAGQAGAVWHAAAIAALVDGAAVRALVALIGDDLRMLALAGRALAGPAEAATAETIAAAIPAAGAGCVAAWCAMQPAPIAARLTLRLPPDWMAGPAEPAIVVWLLDRDEGRDDKGRDDE